MNASSLDGPWTYRSFLNNPTPVGGDADKALALIFGEAQLTITAKDDVLFDAVLDFGGAGMDLFGELVAGVGIGPDTILVTGTGRADTPTAGWVYQYRGYVVPALAEGVDQVPAIVGSVIRTIPHGDGPAGIVASFVAVHR